MKTTEEKIEEVIEEKIEEVIEAIEETPPQPSAQNLELGILVGQMGAKIATLENENKILAAKIQDLEYSRESAQESISALFQRFYDLESKQDEIIEEIEELEHEEKEEIAGDLIEIEIPPEPEKLTETKNKKRHFI